MPSFDLLAKKLVPHYSYFQVAHRLLFTGHSHQAWPDVAFEGQKEAFMSASDQLDSKWVTVFQKMDHLRHYLRNYYTDTNGYYSFSPSTHDLLVRWLSALDLRNKPQIITTDGEFYTVARQLLRAEEEGLEIVYIPQRPSSAIAERVQEVISSRTAAVICSHVFYSSSLVNTSLYELAQVAEHHNVPLLIDDYHATHVLPLNLEKIPQCYLIGGGYKYLQWGAGNAFLRFPQSCQLRPAITGWYASFQSLEEDTCQMAKPVHYDEKDMRFAGSTYDPTPHFRAARVVDFFCQQSLGAEQLTHQYRTQLRFMIECFEALDCSPHQIRLLDEVPLSERAGFLALYAPCAKLIQQKLKEASVHTDVRGYVIRFGSAPYTQKHQIQEAFRRLKLVLDSIK